jgi:hypothetical protein
LARKLYPVEVNLQACRSAKQNALSAEEYTRLMLDRIDNVAEGRLRAWREIKGEVIPDQRPSLENNFTVGKSK